MIRWSLRPESLVFAAADRLGYWRPDDSRDWNVFLFGLRGHPRRVDHFDDLLGVIAHTPQGWQTWLFPATVDPGLSTMTTPQNPSGAARIVPGQYRAMWELGKRPSNGREALMQVGPVTVQRDNDRDSVYDENAPTQSGLFGILLHEPYKEGLEKVGAASAGCVVTKSSIGARQAFRSIKRQNAAGMGIKATWTLFDVRQCPELAALFHVEAVVSRNRVA